MINKITLHKFDHKDGDWVTFISSDGHEYLVPTYPNSVTKEIFLTYFGNLCIKAQENHPNADINIEVYEDTNSNKIGMLAYTTEPGTSA
jgi:hypothetical protein